MLGPRLAQIDRADRAQAGAVRGAQHLDGRGESEGVLGPAVEVQPLALDVGTRELLAASRHLDLAGVDVEGGTGLAQAAHARPQQGRAHAQAQRVAVADQARNVEPRPHALGVRPVELARQSERLEHDIELEAAGLAGAEAHPAQVEVVRETWHPSRLAAAAASVGT